MTWLWFIAYVACGGASLAVTLSMPSVWRGIFQGALFGIGAICFHEWMRRSVRRAR